MEGGNRRWLLRGGVIAVAVLAALVAWLATRGGDEKTSPAPSEAAPRIVSEAGLREAAASLGQPVYWAGPLPGTELELRELGKGGGVQLAYQPAGAEAGRESSDVLTIGSYPLPDPTASMRAFASRPGAIVRRAGGREVVSSAARPTSAYFVSPDNRVEIEVYDPSPRRAMGLALSGKVKPAG